MIEAVSRMIARHRVPLSIKSDNGLQFVSGEFAEFLKDFLELNNAIPHLFGLKRTGKSTHKIVRC